MISTLSKNPDREKVINFTSAYSPFFQAVFGPKSLVVKTPADLAGKTVGVTRGAMEDLEVGKIAPPGVDIKCFEDMTGTVSAYAAGQVQLMYFALCYPISAWSKSLEKELNHGHR